MDGPIGRYTAQSILLHTVSSIISARRGQADLENLFRDVATRAVLRFITNTEVSEPMTKEKNRDDY